MLTLRRLARDLVAIAVVFGLLAAVYLLPPDTSLAEVRGRTSHPAPACPTTYPPLVTGDPDRPGIDVEILGPSPTTSASSCCSAPSAAIGRDFNPRNWAVTRGTVPGARRRRRRLAAHPVVPR